jgi:hypothetical protein
MRLWPLRLQDSSELKRVARDRFEMKWCGGNLQDGELPRFDGQDWQQSKADDETCKSCYVTGSKD